ncbi:MAG: hypothetical protein LBC98_02375 [Prevotellaceae bacterium]|jgi:hypothetical protein|nr:hypothetical protein [Prevotellaceae bacterium]
MNICSTYTAFSAKSTASTSEAGWFYVCTAIGDKASEVSATSFGMQESQVEQFIIEKEYTIFLKLDFITGVFSSSLNTNYYFDETSCTISIPSYLCSDTAAWQAVCDLKVSKFYNSISFLLCGDDYSYMISTAKKTFGMKSLSDIKFKGVNSVEHIAMLLFQRVWLSVRTWGFLATSCGASSTRGDFSPQRVAPRPHAGILYQKLWHVFFRREFRATALGKLSAR